MRAVLDLDPFAAPPGTIAAIASLGDDPLKPHDASSITFPKLKGRDGTVAEHRLFAKTQQRKALIPPEAHSSL
jgi:hypothetical protein